MGKPWALVLVAVLTIGGLGLLVYARRGPSPMTVVVDAPPAPRPPPSPKEEERPPAPAQAGYIGVVVAEQTVDVAPNLDGRLAEVLVRVGDHVAQGAPLAYLDQRTVESDLAVARATVKAARADEAKARLEIADAEARLARSVKLGSLIPAADLDQANSERKLAITRLESASAGVLEAQARVAKLEVSRTDTSVRAPFSGVVAARYLDPGALVHAQQPVVRLISAEALRVRFAVPENEARSLVIGHTVNAHLPALGIDVRGIIETVAPEVDPAARMIFAEARLEAVVDGRGGPNTPATGLVARVTPDRPAPPAR